MPDFYPSAKVKLAIRFEEFSDKTKNPNGPQKETTPPKKSAKNLKTTSPNRTDLVVERRINDAGNAEYFVAGPNTKTTNAGTSTSPNAIVTSNDPYSFGVIGIIPKQATLGINGVHTADTLSLTLRWQDFPIDPRTIRACGVEFYLGTVSAEDYTRGMRGETRTVSGGGASGAQEPRSIVPDNYVQEGFTYSNRRFAGWVDKFEMSREGESAATVKLECTDNSRLLIDQKMPTNVSIKEELPIGKAVATVLSAFPQLEGMTVQYIPWEEEYAVTYKAAKVKSTHPVTLGPTPGGGGDDMTLLDYLVGICGQLGHNLFVDGNYITIQKATSLIGGTRTPRPKDPYVGRTVNGRFYQNRTFVWGVNLKKVEFKREYAGHGPKNYEVRSYNTTTKNMTVARYPEKGDRVIGVLPNGGADEKWNEVSIGIPNNMSEAALKEIARQYYEAMSRSELAIGISTRNLCALGGNNLNPDLLDLKTADPIDIYLDQTEGTSTDANIDAAQTSAASGAAYLKRLGYSDDFAQAYAKARSNTYLTHTYYTRGASIEWDMASGISIDIEAVNYVEIRLDPTATATAVNPNTSANKTTSAQTPPPLSSNLGIGSALTAFATQVAIGDIKK